VSARSSDDALPAGPRQFLTTRWSVVRDARSSDPDLAHEALASLCASYWYPLYRYVRRSGNGADEARDLVQGFFARLLEKRDIASADPRHGRFRAYLLASMKHFLANEKDRERALKRGGGRAPIPIDARDADSRYALEPGHDLTPERAFERSWALALLDRALCAVRADYAARGEQALCAALEGTIGGDAPHGSRSDLGERLGMSEGAVNVAVHRMRRRFREALRAEVLGTVSDPRDVDEELRDLFRTLGS
jgi:RNA polymerase sigma factor (sigma-70 family)